MAAFCLIFFSLRLRMNHFIKSFTVICPYKITNTDPAFNFRKTSNLRLPGALPFCTHQDLFSRTGLKCTGRLVPQELPGPGQGLPASTFPSSPGWGVSSSSLWWTRAWDGQSPTWQSGTGYQCLSAISREKGPLRCV